MCCKNKSYICNYNVVTIFKMGRIEKLIRRLLSVPNDFTWAELVKILQHFGYTEYKLKGKTSGSRRKFVNATKQIISLHEPHPQNIVKKYVLKQIIKQLEL